jgi:hypothetical protein
MGTAVRKSSGESSEGSGSQCEPKKQGQAQARSTCCQAASKQLALENRHARMRNKLRGPLLYDT